MAQWLRPVLLLQKDLGLIPSIHIVVVVESQLLLISVPGDLTSSSELHGHSHMWCSQDTHASQYLFVHVYTRVYRLTSDIVEDEV